MRATIVAVLLAATAAGADEPMGPPEPPDRQAVIAASFPSFVSASARERRMRTSRRVAWTLTACDAVSTFTSKGSEINPLAFGSKPLGVALSIVATWRSLRMEEAALRRHARGRANVIRGVRWTFLSLACGLNIRASF